jgi:hypothetical protein
MLQIRDTASDARIYSGKTGWARSNRDRGHWRDERTFPGRQDIREFDC